MISHWRTINSGYQQFVNDNSVLGIIQIINKKWYWEARTYLNARNADLKPPSGYALNEISAKLIIECILKNTEDFKYL